MKRILTALALLAVATVAVAATYWGYNPTTGLETFHGARVDGGTVQPVVSGTCGTRGAQVGGAFAGTSVAGAVTTCTMVLTFASAAPNGWDCHFKDLTTTTDTLPQASFTTTSCTSTAATIVSGDTIMYDAVGF